MKLRDIGEFGFIQRIRKGDVLRPQGVVQGIGDDASVFDPPSGHHLLLTTDMLVEGVHFLEGRIPMRLLGRKSLAVSLSDIAAMGGDPLDAYVSLAVPADLEVEGLEELYEGLREMARPYGVNLLGGDTTRSPGPLVINVALVGMVPQGKAVLRSGARPGELLYITAQPGRSSAGLHILLHEGRARGDWEEELLHAHLDPIPQIHEGRFLAREGFARAMIDLSDGLLSDLSHLCTESGVGAYIERKLLPVSHGLKAYAHRHRLDLYSMVLRGGEDYGLLFSVQRWRAEEMEHRFQERFGWRPWLVGETTEQRGIFLVEEDGSRRPVVPEGWDHFRTSVVFSRDPSPPPGPT